MIRSETWYSVECWKEKLEVSIGGYLLEAFSCFLSGISGTGPIPLSEGPITSLPMLVIVILLSTDTQLCNAG